MKSGSCSGGRSTSDVRCGEPVMLFFFSPETKKKGNKKRKHLGGERKIHLRRISGEISFFFSHRCFRASYVRRPTISHHKISYVTTTTANTPLLYCTTRDHQQPPQARRLSQARPSFTCTCPRTATRSRSCRTPSRASFPSPTSPRTPRPMRGSRSRARAAGRLPSVPRTLVTFEHVVYRLRDDVCCTKQRKNEPKQTCPQRATAK